MDNLDTEEKRGKKNWYKREDGQKDKDQSVINKIKKGGMILKLGKNNLFLKNYFKKIVIFGLVFGIFLLSSNFAEAAQFGRPNSTISAGSWTAVGAPQLWQTVDEVTANDDTDYAEAAVNTTAEFGLSSVPDPGVSTGHIVRWRYKPAGAGTGEYIVVNLYQGATLIRSSGNISGTRGVYNDASFTLTNAEADSITNYGDLRLMINTTNLGGGESMRVTWLELEVPSNTSPSLSISQPDGVDDTVTVGDLYNITYTLSDPEETVNAAFYYDTDNTGLDGTAITGACASAPEGTGATCSWDTTGVNAGSYYIYGITSDGVNPQVSAYSLGQITINITIEQEILNKVTVLETKVDTLQTKVDQMPQSVWEYANRSLTSFGTLASDIWSYSGRSLDNVANITQGVWEYSTRSLTSFGTLVSDIWSYSGRSLDNVANITQGVWEYSDRTLTSFGTLVSDIWSNSTRTLTSGASIAQDIWNATTRKLTSRQIAENEYIAGVTDSGAVSQVADQPTQENVEYNVELVRKATFDFAGFADAGSTSTLTDSELSEYPDDYWNDYELIMMSGSNVGQKRVICDFSQASYTITLCSSFDNSIASDDKYVISHERKLVHAVWNWSERTLTSGLNIAGDIWSYTGGRTLTSIGSLAVDIWNDTFAPSRRLTDQTLTGGGQLATTADLDNAIDTLIAEIDENQALIESLNNISAADVWEYGSRDVDLQNPQQVWDVAKANLTTIGTIGEQVANNLDAAVSSRSTLTATDVWNAATRTLTDYATSSISFAVWSEATRELTNYGNNITAADVWNVLSGTLTLQDSIGKQLAGNVDVAVSTRASQVSVDAMNDISAADVWSYANRSITDPAAIWEYALTQIGDAGSIGTLIKDNLDAAVSSRGTSDLTAADVWDYVTRTLTSNANFNDPDSATIAAAVWAEATRELTNYGNNITAQDVWNILSSNLTTEGTIGKQLAVNVDVAVSTRSTLTAANVWGYANRSLTDFGTLVADIWNYSTRSLTTFGTLAADIWNNSTRTLTSALLGGGGQIATTADLDAMKTNLITEINENQTLISALNNISATDVWSYASRSLTEEVDLTSTSSKAIWDIAKTQLTTEGSIGKHIVDNLDAAVSTRSTLTAADVWSESTRTLTDYATSNISLAVWSEATRELTSYGNDITAADVWDTLSNTLTLQDSIGKQLAEGVDVAISTRASQASLDALNNISAADVWSYANRSITDPDAIWEYALTQIGNTGSIGKLLKDNIDAAISSRGTSNLTAADVWNSVTRTLTSNANFNDPDSATIAAAVWAEATRELTSYGNDITAQDIWNILSANLTTDGTIGKQLAANVDAAVSTRSTLTAANVWEYANRSLTDFGTLVTDIWSYSTRSLTTFGTLVADIWNDTFAPTRRLTDQTLTGGGSLATQADITAAKNEIISLINALNNISAADVWAYSNRSLTDPDSIWEYALTQIGNSGSIGMLLKTNIDATISSRGTSTLTANDVWNAAVRTLTANTNLGISTPAQIADAIWDEALADHLAEGTTGAALSTASTGGGGGVGGLTIETHTVSEFELGDTAAGATIQVKNNGVPVSGVTPTGVYYDPNNSAKTWPGESGSTVNFTEIGTTGIYTHTFNTTGASLGVYKLAVQASQSTGGTSYSDNFEDGNADGWSNTGGTYTVYSEGAPQGYVYRKTDYGGFMYAFSTAGGNFADFTYTAKVRMDSTLPGGANADSEYVGITFRYANSSQNYDFYFRKGAGNVRLRKNGATLQESPSGTAWSSDTWYTMKVVVTGGNIKGYVNDVLKVDYTDSSPLPEGMVGMMTYNSVGSWDDINVTVAGTSQYAYIAKDFAIVTPKATQASINALNNISAADVWSYANRSITDPDAIWEYALTQIGETGSIGKLLKDNIDATISSRGTSNLTAADVWNATTRTLTDYATSSIATAVWQSATRELTNYGNDITAQDVWNVLITNLTTAGSIGKAFADNRMINFVSDGEVLAGSGANNYKAKLYIYNLETQLVDAAATPTITIYNAVGSAFITDANMTKIATGTYEYVTTIGAGQGPGRWETVVTINTGGTNPIKTSGYFEVEASPARVTINSITDNTVPSITANFAIANEGTLSYEYHYKYCVVDTIENVCDGVGEIAWGQGAEWIEPGVEEQFNKTLTVNNTGTYIWKVVVYWGTEKSVAALQFNAVSGVTLPTCGDGSCNGSETCSSCPTDCGTCPSPPGGGGGVGPAPTPPPVEEEPVCSGADFNKDGIVNSVDFSILLYFWKTQPPFRNACVDINKDIQVNSVDFSILLYQWGKPGINIK